MIDHRTVPVPLRMRHLPVDARGYPVPCMVLIDDAGLPHFAVNNSVIRDRVLRDDLCSICGGKLSRGRWFVGGPKSAFHPAGAYNDPPMHRECVVYALQVCPYLAAPSWSHEVGILKYQQSVGRRGVVGVVDPTVMPDRPNVFVAVMAVGQKLVGGSVQTCVVPARPYRRVEFWQAGVLLDQGLGWELAAADVGCPVLTVQRLAQSRSAVVAQFGGMGDIE